MITPTQEEAAAKAIGKALMQRGIGPLALAKIALAAAAQVAEPSDIEKTAHQYVKDSLNGVKSHTIERCAQVAEETADQWGIPTHRIIAAIRKLKDEA